jgi:hypothetical protein
MNLGKYAIVNASEYHLKEEPEMYWTFVPISSEQELELAQFLTKYFAVPAGDQTVYDWLMIAWRELAMTFGGTNITEDDGKIILEKSSDIPTREIVLKKLPMKLVAELWTALGEINPLLGARKNPLEKPIETESSKE